MKPTSLGDILEEIKRKHPELSKRMGEAKTLDRWEAAVGPAIAKKSKVVAVRGGTLIVEVAHPVWRSELHYRKTQILEALNAPAGKDNGSTPSTRITDLYFVEPGAGRAKSEKKTRYPKTEKAGSKSS